MDKEAYLHKEFEKILTETSDLICDFLLKKKRKNPEMMVPTLLLLARALSVHASCALEGIGDDLSSQTRKRLLNIKNVFARTEDDTDDELIKKGYIKINL